ncbi:hypothetical protein SRHO_G00202990 [Serrasalmus rhombeus]
MQKQNVITELLVKQQQLSQLPTKDISVFKGDALHYKFFIRAFEHAIEHKTDNDQDKLYFLEQYTDGEPQELVRNCAHMTPIKGYRKAKRLLHEHYGNELWIASAYIAKALKWPQVKSGDGKALNAYAMFLIRCCNSMEDIELLEEMDNPTNLRTVLSKLPYKMKERWRTEAFELKERRGRRARFADLENFIDRQAKIAMVPLFGNISDSCPTTIGKMDQKEKQLARKEVRGSSFATNVAAKHLKKHMSSLLMKHSNILHGRKLNVKGKPTRILLSTMGQYKPGERKLMNSFVISDLEVCGLKDTMFIELPKVEADVGLLIGANCSRAMEPWRIINGQAGGPYAVKTAIG